VVLLADIAMILYSHFTINFYRFANDMNEKQKETPNKAVDSTSTRVTPPADPSLRSGQESRHGQP
jgi:hypothetical protein